MKNKTIKRIIGMISAASMALLLAGCTAVNISDTGKDNSNHQAEIPGVETGIGLNTQNNTNPSDSASDNGAALLSKMSEKSFASRVSGNYIGKDSDGENIAVSIYNVYGNLYAVGGYTDQEAGDLYSFWCMEIIPEKPEDLFDENINECNVGVMSFSVMSNIGKYWSSPKEGVLSITSDGIKVSGKESNPFSFGQGEISLTASTDYKGFFDTDYSGSIEETAYDPADGFCGLWKEKNSDTPLYLAFEGGSDYGRCILFKKEPGKEVYLNEGIFSADKTGNAVMTTASISSGSPDKCNFKYSVDGDTLLIFGISDFPVSEQNSSGNAEFERADENDIPVTALFEPDDVKAIKGGLSFTTAEGKTRNITVQFKASQDVENNGTGFVRIGDVVFFRYYDEDRLKGNECGLWADFTDNQELRNAGCIAYYDLKTGESGIACEDGSSSEIYYMDGRFYTEFFSADDYSSSSVIKRFWPDGSNIEAYTQEGYSYIDSISDDGKYIDISDFTNGSCYRANGTYYFDYIEMYQNQYLMGSKFVGGNVYTVNYEMADGKNKIKIKEFKEDTYETLELGEYDTASRESYGYPQLRQITANGDKIYVGIGWYDGDAVELQDYLVFAAEPGKEGSMKIVQEGIPNDGGAYYEPYFYFNYADEMLFTEVNPEGEVKLSEKSYGDLLYFDSPFGVSVIKEKFIGGYPFDGKEGELTTVFQEAYCIGNKIFAVKANASYYPEGDIGWKRSYLLEGLNYGVFDLTDLDSGMKEISPKTGK